LEGWNIKHEVKDKIFVEVVMQRLFGFGANSAGNS
jgi:hypothetical protein